MSETRPILVILSDLLKPVRQTQTTLSHIEGKLAGSECDDLICQGLLVLAVSRVETMLTDTLKYFLCALPEKIEKDTLSVTKEDVLTHPFDLLEIQVERQLWSLGYKPIEDIVQCFCITLSLDGDAKALSAPLREIKATRNVLLHNNLVANATYLSLAGPDRRVRQAGDTLSVDPKYLGASLKALSGFVDAIDRLITVKYASYTKLAALRRLWSFCFDSPVMPFEDFWKIEEENDCIRYRKTGKHESSISSSEKIMLDIWRVHFSGPSSELGAFSMRTFDEENQQKVQFLLWLFRWFSLQPPIAWPNKAIDGDEG